MFLTFQIQTNPWLKHSATSFYQHSNSICSGGSYIPLGCFCMDVSWEHPNIFTTHSTTTQCAPVPVKLSATILITLKRLNPLFYTWSAMQLSAMFPLLFHIYSGLIFIYILHCVSFCFRHVLIREPWDITIWWQDIILKVWKRFVKRKLYEWWIN